VTALAFVLDPERSSNRRTDFHYLWLIRRVSMQGRSFSGSVRSVWRHFTDFGTNRKPLRILPQRI